RSLDGEGCLPTVIAERPHGEGTPFGIRLMFVQQTASHLVMAVGKDVGFNLHGFSDHPFDWKGAIVDTGSDVLDDDARLAHVAISLCCQSVSGPVRSRALRGGSRNASEWVLPCAGRGAASTAPRLPSPLPPYSWASLFRDSRHRPPRGTPTR